VCTPPATSLRSLGKARIVNILAALTVAHNPAVQMIDMSFVHIRHRAARVAGNREQLMGRSRGGPTNENHAIVAAMDCMCASH
jgi:hypothetical protein